MWELRLIFNFGILNMKSMRVLRHRDELINLAGKVNAGMRSVFKALMSRLCGSSG